MPQVPSSSWIVKSSLNYKMSTVNHIFRALSTTMTMMREPFPSAPRAVLNAPGHRQVPLRVLGNTRNKDPPRAKHALARAVEHRSYPHKSPRPHHWRKGSWTGFGARGVRIGIICVRTGLANGIQESNSDEPTSRVRRLPRSLTGRNSHIYHNEELLHSDWMHPMNTTQTPSVGMRGSTGHILAILAWLEGFNFQLSYLSRGDETSPGRPTSWLS